MKAKKSLGQNFLKSKKALTDMIKVAEVSSRDSVLEIGPGKGVLTEALLSTGAKVLAVEADRELATYMSEKFAQQIESKKLKIISGDIMEFDVTSDLRLPTYKVVANIPYYITGAIIRKFLESSSQPKSMTLLVQKEVAERIIARDKKESILSISVKAYGTPKIVAKVPRRYFSPEPKVDSAIIHISNISKKNFKNFSEENFFRLIKASFGQKRKTLLKNLRNSGFIVPEGLVDQKIRAEDLGIKDFIHLAKKLFVRLKQAGSDGFPQNNHKK